jgi:MSHA biogenesis protein MshI
VGLCASFRKEGSEAATLQRLRRSLKLDTYSCTTLMAGDQYQLHYLDAPAVPAAEVKAAVRWRVKDIIDYPVESAALDVLHIPVDPDAPAREAALYVVTARNEAIAACVRPFEESRVELGAVDIPDLAQRNLTALFEREGAAAALLAFYDQGGILTFTRGGELLLSRRIEVGLRELFDDAGSLREDELERAALEAQRSLDRFDYQFPQVAVAKLMVAPVPREADLAARLGASLGIPVAQVDLADVIDFAAHAELERREAQSHYLPLLGAALRTEGSVAAR